MGDEGTLMISESGSRGGAYREQTSPIWDKWVEEGFLKAPVVETPKTQPGVVLDVRETVAPPKFDLAVEFNDPYHKPHLENFFDTISGKSKLNCPVDVGYETAVSVLRVNDAVHTGRKLTFKKSEFKI